MDRKRDTYSNIESIDENDEARDFHSDKTKTRCDEFLFVAKRANSVVHDR